MQFGTLSLEVLETGTFALDGGAMFGVVPKNLWEKAYHTPDEQNRIPMKAQCLLVQGKIDGKEKVILVDTGNGEKFPPKLANIYKMDTSLFGLERSLARFHLAPEDITDVILTHLHFDHAGGATRLDEHSRLVPSFPNARYYVQREHYAWAQSPSDKDRASFMPDDYEPLVAEGMLHFLDGEGEVFPGFRLMPLFGHTQAMQALLIHSGTQTLVFAADLLPTSAHIAPPYIMGYDNFPLTTLKEKKSFLPRAVDEEWLIVFEHDAFTQAAYIQRTDKGFTRGKTVTITEWT